MSYKEKQHDLRQRAKVAKKGRLVWIATDIYRQSGAFNIKGDTFFNTIENRQVMIDRGARSVKLEGKLEL